MTAWRISWEFFDSVRIGEFAIHTTVIMNSNLHRISRSRTSFLKKYKQNSKLLVKCEGVCQYRQTLLLITPTINIVSIWIWSATHLDFETLTDIFKRTKQSLRFSWTLQLDIDKFLQENVENVNFLLHLSFIICFFFTCRRYKIHYYM